MSSLTGQAYSPLPHESSGMPAKNLAIDVQDIELDLKQGFEFELEGRSLDVNSTRFLTRLRDDIKDGKIKLRKKWEDKD